MRRGVAAGLVALAALALASPATGSFHLMKIREVGNGGTSDTDDYVELQMYASGQNFVGGHSIVSYNDTGGVLSTFTFPTGVALGASQRTILVARGDGTPPAGADFIDSTLVVPNDGAICFESIDCVAFGAFPGFSGAAPSPVGTPAPAVPAGSALERSIAPGCATLLEAGDDTDDSVTDFALAPPSPRGNTTFPTETACGPGDTDPPETKITKAPDELEKAKAKIKFKSSEPNSEFRCKLDKKRFKPCDSPFRKRVDLGKHKFKVFAIDAAGNADPSPAKAKFKRVED